MDHRAWGASPLGKSRNVAPEGGVIGLVYEDAEEGGGLIAGVWLELGVDIDDECGRDRRKQTGLPFK